MLVHLYIIISLFVFLISMLVGSSPEASIIKGAMIFITLVLITRTGMLLLNVISVKGTTGNQTDDTPTASPDNQMKKAA